MKIPSLLLGASLSLPWVGAAENIHARAQQIKAKHYQRSTKLVSRSIQSATAEPSFLTEKTAKFVVNGTEIPQVPFDIGESYAGILPIQEGGNASDPNQLYFWFFPSQNPAAKKEIVIWLNGGPGCSSMEGLLQENGPFLWQPGTYTPAPNPYSWTNLTNVIYIDQPIGTGLSPSTEDAPLQITNETVVAKQFMGFWHNLVETFDMQGYDIYLTGESYAGMYVPYIAYYMLEANDTQYYNVKGIQINDPVIGHDTVQTLAPAAMHLNAYANVFNLNKTFTEEVNARADSCGYTSWMEKALQFPPAGPLPIPSGGEQPGCSVWGDIIEAAYYVNPCFNMYHLTDFCPFAWDVMGFAPSAGPNNFFNDSDVQKAINAPPTNFMECGDPNLNLQADSSLPSALGPLPVVIERTNNVLIGHGMYDYLLLVNGTLATIQNMTWHGKQGFQERPKDDFFVPYSSILTPLLQESAQQSFPEPYVGLVGGAGFMGTTHTERGLTFVTVNNAGHEIPQYNPGAAYRQLEFLLGRIESLTQQGDFTTETGNFTGTSPIV
ncbi:hypothetical protein NLU13_5876 [Sarocladium strictum]|uniref:Carboxypeptidase n=1 Tax=Sarocladium strictum TaxID=5046 RepID=A0AA39GFK6_SARSR|nr:hypothetical protein NLU13_5876 [Sarocladium strictum]